MLKGKNIKPDSKIPDFRSICRKDEGFTLVEVLLAFFIFSIIFITIYTSYSGTFRTINMTENRMALYRKAAIVLEKISEDLQSAYISLLPLNSFGEPSENTRFLGEDKDINGQDADILSFFSRVSPLFENGTEAATGLLISYSVIQGTEEDELVLMRTEASEFADEADELGGLIVSDSLQSVNFVYYDDNGDTHEEWDSDSEQFNGRLPRMVSVALEFINYENPDAPLKVMTSVAMPVN